MAAVHDLIAQMPVAGDREGQEAREPVPPAWQHPALSRQ